MTYTLDHYQQRDYKRLREAAKGDKKRIIYQAPTGFGKTVVASHLIEQATSRGRNVLFLAPRRELVDQCADKLDENGIPFRAIMANYGRGDQVSQVCLASKDTLYSRWRRYGSSMLPSADLIILDEAHLTNPTTKTILDAYPQSFVIGLTATPARPNAATGLGDVYSELLIGPTYDELIEKGRLVRSRLFRPSAPNMKGVGNSNGDWSRKETEKRAMRDDLIGDIVSHWQTWCNDRKTIVFATGIRHSLHIAERFRKAGIQAEHIDGEMPTEERDEVLRRFRSGETQLLSNAQILTFGLDIPDVSCIVFACPTKSIVKWKQCVGRGLRAAPGKSDCIVMDHANASKQHGMPDEDIPWTLDTKTRQKSHKAGGEADPLMTCQGCSAAYDRKQLRCPECGKPNPKAIQCQKCDALYMGKPACPSCGEPAPKKKPEAVEHAPGELHEIMRGNEARKVSIEEKQKHWDSCLWVCINKGLKVGAAVHMYKDRFGVTPFNVGLARMPKGKAQWQLKGRDIKEHVWDREADARPKAMVGSV